MTSTIEIGERIKTARDRKNMTQEQLGDALGMNKSTIQRYETGQILKIKIPVLESMAKTLNVDPNWLALKTDVMSEYKSSVIENLLPLPKTKKVPLVGTIACGTPITAVENIEDYIDMSENVHADFALRCRGDSMINARIFDGDIVYIKQQPDLFKNAFSAMWWAIATLTTVGYGDIYPITVLGKLLSAVIALLGIGLVAVPTGIITSGFMEVLEEKKETKEHKDCDKKYCPYCGHKLDD